MQCPLCDERVAIPANAELNLYHYGGSALVRTECCGGAVRANAIRAYRVEPYKGDAKEDDWGRKFA